MDIVSSEINFAAFVQKCQLHALGLCEMVSDELSLSSFCIKIENIVPQGLCTSSNSLSEKNIFCFCREGIRSAYWCLL